MPGLQSAETTMLQQEPIQLMEGSLQLGHSKPGMPNPADSGGSAGNTDDSCSTRGPPAPAGHRGGGTSSGSCEELTTLSAGASPQDSPSSPGPADHMVVMMMVPDQLPADDWVGLDTTAGGLQELCSEMLDGSRHAAATNEAAPQAGTDGLSDGMLLDEEATAGEGEGRSTAHAVTDTTTTGPQGPAATANQAVKQQHLEMRPPGPPLSLQLPPYSLTSPGPSTQELVTSPSWMTMSHPLSDHCPGATNITLLEVPDEEEEEGDWGEVAQGARLESVMSTPVNLSTVMQRLPSMPPHALSAPSSLRHRAHSLPVPLGWQPSFPMTPHSAAVGAQGLDTSPGLDSSGSLKHQLPSELQAGLLASPSTTVASAAGSVEGHKGSVIPGTPQTPASGTGVALESPSGTAAAGGRRSARAVKGVTNFAALHSGDIRGLAAQQQQQRQVARARALQQQQAAAAAVGPHNRDTEVGVNSGQGHDGGSVTDQATAAHQQVLQGTASAGHSPAGAMQPWQLGCLGATSSGPVPSALWSAGDWQMPSAGMTSCASGTDMTAMGMGMGGMLVQDVPAMSTPAPTPSQLLVPPPRTVNGTTSRKKRPMGSATARPSSGVPAGHSCASCGTQATPVWRAGPAGPKSLCNACSLRWRKVTKGQ